MTENKRCKKKYTNTTSITKNTYISYMYINKYIYIFLASWFAIKKETLYNKVPLVIQFNALTKKVRHLGCTLFLGVLVTD